MIDAEMIYRAIGAVVLEKQMKGTYPDVATSLEVVKYVGAGTAVVEDIARQLKDAGRISIGQGINYDYYRIRADKR